MVLTVELFDLRFESVHKRKKIHPSSHHLGNVELNNLRLCTNCIFFSFFCSTMMLLLLCYSISFPVASTTHPLTHSLVEWECHIKW